MIIFSWNFSHLKNLFSSIKSDDADSYQAIVTKPLTFEVSLRVAVKTLDSRVDNSMNLLLHWNFCCTWHHAENVRLEHAVSQISTVNQEKNRFGLSNTSKSSDWNHESKSKVLFIFMIVIFHSNYCQIWQAQERFHEFICYVCKKLLKLFKALFVKVVKTVHIKFPFV